MVRVSERLSRSCLRTAILLAVTLLAVSASPALAALAGDYAWTNFVGQPHEMGTVDGTGSAARFNTPTGIAVDSAGNLYVADQDNNTIRKVTPSGVVTTLAGLAGTFGSTDGTGGVAQFFLPFGVAVDGAGNVYVTDLGNHTIRKVTPAGAVTTLAGLAGSIGSTDGTGDAARFTGPSGVAADSVGNVYVADQGSHTIRKVTPAGVVTTLAGLAGSSGSTDGTGSVARFSCPSGVAADGAGNVYVADFGNDTIRKVTPARVVTTIGGAPGVSGTADGVGGSANFSSPAGIVADAAGNLHVADWGNSRISKGTPAPTQYALTVNVVAGHGTVTPTGGTHDEGTVVSLTATPDAGYRVLAWSGTDDDDKKTNANSVTMNGDKTVTIAFESIPVEVYSLTIVPDLDIIDAPAPESYAAGSVVTVEAPPAPDGYAFDHWSGDASGTDNPIEVVMDGDKELIASYVQTTNTNTTTQRGCGQDVGLFNLVLFGSLSFAGLGSMKRKRGHRSWLNLARSATVLSGGSKPSRR